MCIFLYSEPIQLYYELGFQNSERFFITTTDYIQRFSEFFVLKATFIFNSRH